MARMKKEPATKQCQHCGIQMVQPRWANGKLDNLFSQRKFCSSTCAGQRETTDPAAGRKRAQRSVEMHQCNRCWTLANLQRHHIDRNPMNNTPENIEVLCQTCHLREHLADGTWGHGQKNPESGEPKQG